MYCRNCGKQVDEKALICPNCGVYPLAERKFCQNCGAETQYNQEVCTKCGVKLVYKPSPSLVGKSKVAAGVLGILLGSLGIHKFYLGYTGAGIIMLLITVVGGLLTLGVASFVMGIIGIIEGIIYLTKTDEEFQEAYVNNQHPWF